MTKMQFMQYTSEKWDYRYCSIASKFLEIRLENWTKQKKHDSNCDKLRTKKSRFVSKKKGFFSLQSSMEWALTVGVGVDSKCNPCQQFNFISLFLYIYIYIYIFFLFFYFILFFLSQAT